MILIFLIDFKYLNWVVMLYFQIFRSFNIFIKQHFLQINLVFIFYYN